jgi:hypothetical protein
MTLSNFSVYRCTQQSGSLKILHNSEAWYCAIMIRRNCTHARSLKLMLCDQIMSINAAFLNLQFLERIVLWRNSINLIYLEYEILTHASP